MDETSSSEHTVYLYHTIVNGNDSFIGDVGNCAYAFINNDDNDEEKDQVMYLSLEEQDESYSPDVVLNSLTEYDNEEEHNLPNIEFVLEDEETYLKNNILKDVDENYTFDSELISIEPGNDSDTFEIEEDNEDSQDVTVNQIYSDDDTNEYNVIKVRMEDGSYSYINSTLWERLVGTIKQEEASKVVGIKKEKKFACTYYGCDKVYSTAHHLTVHMRNHTGSRPYQCLVANCNKAFATSYSLKAHIRTHTGEAPYACSICPKHFKTSGDLQKHVRTHTGEKPFKCPIEGCGRSFTTSNIRKVHVRSHTGERPYKCTHPNCKKAFASATNFKNHMRIHSGEKPYKCPVAGCDKRFTEYSSLFKHNTVHKPYVPFKCEYCNQLCKYEATLRAHKQAIHKIFCTEDGTEVRVKKELDGNYVFCSNE